MALKACNLPIKVQANSAATVHQRLDASAWSEPRSEAALGSWRCALGLLRLAIRTALGSARLGPVGDQMRVSGGTKGKYEQSTVDACIRTSSWHRLDAAGQIPLQAISTDASFQA
ncbi:unnamed protein product [Clonostachys rosea]|uniref:Uncharacterized protein n=1 Tax=Bionectria ochroleuca TaxID=29856 RepID=A0ABY6TSX4_BIOOC|nr:unnamed protein product [Clonostachys rosea]